MGNELGWKFQVGDWVGCKANPAMTGIVVGRVIGPSPANTAQIIRNYHVIFDITSPVQIEERDLIQVSEPKTTPFEALGWKFQLGDMVGHRACRISTGIVTARVAIQSGESPYPCLYYHVRSGIAPTIQIEESELFRATSHRGWSFKEDPVEPTGEDSGATGE